MYSSNSPRDRLARHARKPLRSERSHPVNPFSLQQIAPKSPLNLSGFRGPRPKIGFVPSKCFSPCLSVFPLCPPCQKRKLRTLAPLLRLASFPQMLFSVAKPRTPDPPQNWLRSVECFLRSEAPNFGSAPKLASFRQNALLRREAPNPGSTPQIGVVPSNAFSVASPEPWIHSQN